MMMLPCAFWPLAEHAEFGQNCFDASIGSGSVCICYSMPMDACFFKSSFPFHQIVGFYRLWPDPSLRLPTAAALVYRRRQLDTPVMRHVFQHVCRPLATAQT